MILGLARVSNSKFKDPPAIVNGPEQAWDILVALIRPEPEHHPAIKEGGNPDEIARTEVGMRVAVRSFDIRAGIRRKPIGRRAELVL